MRPIVRRSAQARDRAIARAEAAAPVRRSRPLQATVGGSQRPETQIAKRHAAIPQPISVAYEIAPISNVSGVVGPQKGNLRFKSELGRETRRIVLPMVARFACNLKLICLLPPPPSDPLTSRGLKGGTQEALGCQSSPCCAISLLRLAIVHGIQAPLQTQHQRVWMHGQTVWQSSCINNHYVAVGVAGLPDIPPSMA